MWQRNRVLERSNSSPFVNVVKIADYRPLQASRFQGSCPRPQIQPCPPPNLCPFQIRRAPSPTHGCSVPVPRPQIRGSTSGPQVLGSPSPSPGPRSSPLDPRAEESRFPTPERNGRCCTWCQSGVRVPSGALAQILQPLNFVPRTPQTAGLFLATATAFKATLFVWNRAEHRTRFCPLDKRLNGKENSFDGAPFVFVRMRGEFCFFRVCLCGQVCRKISSVTMLMFVVGPRRVVVRLQQPRLQFSASVCMSPFPFLSETNEPPEPRGGMRIWSKEPTPRGGLTIPLKRKRHCDAQGGVKLDFGVLGACMAFARFFRPWTQSIHSFPSCPHSPTTFGFCTPEIHWREVLEKKRTAQRGSHWMRQA